MLSLEREFPQDPGLIYLNHAALGPWPKRCGDAIQAFAKQNVYRGAADYEIWYRTEAALREKLAWLINAPTHKDIAIMKNTSECLSAIAWGLDWKPGDNLVVGRQEFPSNLLPWRALKRVGVETREVDLYQDKEPEILLMDAIDENTRLLSVSAVQFDTGLAMDLERLGQACEDRGILFCVDAIQGLGALPFDVQAVKAHFVAADGHKWLLAPEGAALFYIAEEVRESLSLYQQGWRMVDDYFVFDRSDWTPSKSARRFEAGSGNTLGMIGLDASLSLFQDLGIDTVSERLTRNARLLMDGLGDISGVRLITPDEPGRFAGIVTFKIKGVKDQDVHRGLVDKGIVCSVRNGVRLAPGFYHCSDQMLATVESVAGLAAQLA